MTDRRWERWAAVCSSGAAIIHGGVAPDHFSEWWAYGLFFTAAAVAQAIFALLLITHGLQLKGKTWDDLRPSVYWAGIAGNLLILAMWVVTRTVGVPVGPDAGEVEAVGPVDVLSKILEAALVLLLAGLLVRIRRRQAGAPPAG